MTQENRIESDKLMNIAIVNEYWDAGAARCARALEKFLSGSHHVRYYPRPGADQPETIFADLAAFQPDIVHCHSYYTNLPYRFLADVSHVYQTVFTPHDTRAAGSITMDPVCYGCQHFNLCFRCAFVGRARKLLLLNPHFWRRFYHRCVHLRTSSDLLVITPSDWLRRRLLATEMKRFEIYRVHHGIDLSHYRPVSAARSVLKLPESAKIIFFSAYTVGWKINPHKGVLDLADAFIQTVLPRHPNALLMIAGGGLMPNHPNIKPLGCLRIDELPLYYSAADVFAAPSIADNFPFTVLEAMGCGSAIVAARTGGIPEAIEDGQSGRLVPQSNPKALGEALSDLLENREKRERMGRAARQRAEQLFGMDRFIRRHEQLYLQALDKRHSQMSRS